MPPRYYAGAMLRALQILIPLGLTIYALVDCISTPDERIRNLPKYVWMILIVLIAIVGPITWLIAGRPKRRGNGGRTQRRVLPPDDDPDFLRKL